MQNIYFPWSDNWWIEKDKAWFCGGRIGALFCVDMNNQQCELVVRIPDDDFRNYRLHSYCIKHKDIVFCLPNQGKNIWCYDVQKTIWEKIEIDIEASISFLDTFYSKDRIWLLEVETGKIYEINQEKRVLEKEYRLPQDGTIVSEYVLMGSELYCVKGRKVYCINVDDGGIREYEISIAKADLYTISYDGCYFWLSGFCKEIYVWNPEQGVVKVIADFPEQFGIYNFNENENSLVDRSSFFTNKDYPFFYRSISLGKYIWFIPFQTNAILYVDKETYNIYMLEIEEEQETKESIKNHEMEHKYLIEYIRENRFIGLYSLKNRLIFEIDTVSLSVKNRDYELSNSAILAIMEADGEYSGQKFFKENKEKDQFLFSILLKANTKKREKPLQSVGELIYDILD